MLEISVIIATYNRSADLRTMLESLCLQECDLKYEIIIIDNNSNDDTKVLVGSFSEKFGGRLKYMFERKQGKSYALNTAVQAAEGKIIAFIDDDVIVDKSWLVNIKKCFDDYGCDGLGGRILPLYPPHAPKWMKDNRDLLRGPIVSFDYGEDIKPFERDPMYAFVGANAAYKRECFSESGLFRTDIGPAQGTNGEDTEFFRRVETNNNKLVYCGKALVWHKVNSQRMNYGYFREWYFNTGKYYAIEEKGEVRNQSIIYYFGIPRHVIKHTVKGFFILIISVFNRLKYLKAMKSFFVSLGKCYQYRKLSSCRK